MSAMKDMNVSDYERERRKGRNPKEQPVESFVRDVLLVACGGLFVLALDVAWALSK